MPNYALPRTTRVKEKSTKTAEAADPQLLELNSQLSLGDKQYIQQQNNFDNHSTELGELIDDFNAILTERPLVQVENGDRFIKQQTQKLESSAKFEETGLKSRDL